MPPSSTIGFTRDNLGRATTLTQSVSGLTPTVTFNQAFDASSNRTELKATIGSTLDFKNNYQYDTLQRLTEIVQQGQSGGNSVTGKRATFAYNALSQRTNLVRFQTTGGVSNKVVTTDYTYDTINRLSSLIHKQGSTILAGYDYAYDGLSRPTSIDSETDGVSTFTYDATSQLTAADHSSQTDESYGFDANGNRNSSGFTIGTNNQTTESPDYTYTYDDEGNRTSRTETATDKITEYSWDYRNRLTVVKERTTSGGSVVKQVDYEYDAFNRLVKRTYDADGAGSGSATSQYWVYDEGINAVLQFDGSGASNVSHRYLWTNEVDELIADEQIGSDTLYGLGDHLGTIRDIANFNEGTSMTSVTNHRKYNSFGKLVSESNTAVDMVFGFTGKQLDEATGLQHNLFRWYDSDLGQWLSDDPIGFNAGDENVRRYVGNRTTNSIDPDGLKRYLIGGSANNQPTHHSYVGVDDGERVLIFGLGAPSNGSLVMAFGNVLTLPTFLGSPISGYVGIEVLQAPSVGSLGIDYLVLESSDEEDERLFQALMPASEKIWPYHAMAANCHGWAQAAANIGLVDPVPFSEWEYHGVPTFSYWWSNLVDPSLSLPWFPSLANVTPYSPSAPAHIHHSPSAPAHIHPLDPKNPIWTNPPSGPRLPVEWTQPVDRVESQGIERKPIDATSCIR